MTASFVVQGVLIVTNGVFESFLFLNWSNFSTTILEILSRKKFPPFERPALKVRPFLCQSTILHIFTIFTCFSECSFRQITVKANSSIRIKALCGVRRHLHLMSGTLELSIRLPFSKQR